MTFDYPPIHENELYFAYALRYHNYTGNARAYKSFQDLFETTSRSVNAQFISRVAASIKKLKLNKEDYIENHSVLPYYRLFTSVYDYPEIEYSFLHREANTYVLKFRRGAKGESVSGDSLWYCPICHRETGNYSSLDKYHQIPGVYICIKHRCYLKKVSLQAEKYYVDPTMWDTEAIRNEDQWLHGIAEDVDFIFKEKPEYYLEDIVTVIHRKLNRLIEEQKHESAENELKKMYVTLPVEYQMYSERFTIDRFLKKSYDLRVGQLEMMILIRVLFGSFQRFYIQNFV